jgi:hypothetical protein
MTILLCTRFLEAINNLFDRCVDCDNAHELVARQFRCMDPAAAPSFSNTARGKRRWRTGYPNSRGGTTRNPEKALKCLDLASLLLI